MRLLQKLVRFIVFLVIAVGGIAAGWLLFLEYPDSARELVGVVLLLLAVPLVLRVAGAIVSSIAPSYNVAEVGVTGPITRSDGGGALPGGPIGTAAGRMVEQIERADADRSVEALLVRLNTPGGEIVPSEDIKLAVERFEGPTIAYATDTCASGGYEIASGCDEIWARNGSIVGSIGVIGSRVTTAELADSLGIEYEQLTAGEYKDAGTPLKELEDHERSYLQGIVDDYYDQFVENVAERREVDPADIRETEARVYLGNRAKEHGLVDELGTRTEVIERLEDRLDTAIVVEQFQPRYALAERLQTGVHRIAYAVGSGVAGSVTDDDRPLRLR